MYRLLIVCSAFMAAACSILAQPHEPFSLPQGGDDLIVSKHLDNVVEVFYYDAASSTPRHYTYDLTTDEMLSTAHAVGATGAEWSSRVDAAIAAANDTWAAMAHWTRLDGDVRLYESYLVTGSYGNDSQVRIYQSEYDPGQFGSGGPLVNCRFAARPDSGFIVTGSETGTWGVETSANVFYLVSPEAQLYWETIGDHFLQVYPFALSQDTAVVLSYATLGGTQVAELYLDCEPGPEENCTRTDFYEAAFSPLAAVRTVDGLHFILHDYTYEILEIDAWGQSLILDGLPTERDYRACASHPVYGIACAYRDGANLRLTRIDVNGAIVDSDEMLVYHAAEGLPTSVQINDSGEVTVAWGTANAVVIDWSNPLDLSPGREPLVPESIALSAYPNPFNSEVRIEYSLPAAGDIDLSVYNIQGQLVEKLLNQRATAGEHSALWTPHTGTGVYFISLITPTQQRTQKVLYLK